MALSAVPAYGAQGAKNTIGTPSWIGSPIAAPKPKALTGSRNSGVGLGSTGGAYNGASSALGTGKTGTGSTTTTTTVTPLQVYQSDIDSDPQTVGAMGMFGAQTSNLAAARADAIQRAVIGAGWDPSGQMGGTAASYAGDVTPQTLAQAASNPMSQKAQLDLQLQQANANQPYDLAASGMGRSGAAAINAGNLQRQYQTSSYQGMNDLLNSIYGAANTYAGSYNDAVNQLAYQRSLVAQRLQNMAGYSQQVTVDPGVGTDSPQPQGLAASPAYAGAPSTWPSQTNQAVQRVIKQLGGTSNPRAYQTLKNTIRGG